jgi:hypothetical protein
MWHPQNVQVAEQWVFAEFTLEDGLPQQVAVSNTNTRLAPGSVGFSGKFTECVDSTLQPRLPEDDPIVLPHLIPETLRAPKVRLAGTNHFLEVEGRISLKQPSLLHTHLHDIETGWRGKAKRLLIYGQRYGWLTVTQTVGERIWGMLAEGG